MHHWTVQDTVSTRGNYRRWLRAITLSHHEYEAVWVIAERFLKQPLSRLTRQYVVRMLPSSSAVCSNGAELNVATWWCQTAGLDVRRTLEVRLARYCVYTSDMIPIFQTWISSDINTVLILYRLFCFIRLCKPQPSDIILDPMCGTGAIPLEVSWGTVQWPRWLVPASWPRQKKSFWYKTDSFGL